MDLHPLERQESPKRAGTSATNAGSRGEASDRPPPQQQIETRDGEAKAGSHRGWRVAKWTSFGLAGAAAATGIVAAVVASKNTTKLENAGCQENEAGVAVDKDGHASDMCQPYLDTYNTAHKWEIAGFVGAGAFAVAWLVLTLTEPPSDNPVPPRRLHPPPRGPVPRRWRT